MKATYNYMFSIPAHGRKTVLYASTIHVCIKLCFIQRKVSICGNYSTFPFLLAVGGGHVVVLSAAAFPDHGATQPVLCQCCTTQLYPVNSHLPSPWCYPRFHIPLCLPGSTWKMRSCRDCSCSASSQLGGKMLPVSLSWKSNLEQERLRQLKSVAMRTLCGKLDLHHLCCSL